MKLLNKDTLILRVKVKCSDNDEYIGILEKGTRYEEGYYHCKQEENGRDNYWFRSKADIVDITLSKRDYLIFKNAARAQEKEAKKEESIGENDDGNA